MSDDKKNKDRKPRLRPVSRITSSPFGRLRTASCFPEIERRMRLGWSTRDLADMIHEEYGELKEIAKESLITTLNRYRASLPAVDLSVISPHSMVGRKATEHLSKGIDELSEIEKLYRLQMKRIDIEFSNEEKIAKLFPTTGREVFVAMKILKQSADLKMELGLTKRQPIGVEVTGQFAAEIGDRYGKESIGKIVADSDARRKVLGMAERLLAIGAKAGIDAVEMLAVPVAQASSNFIDAKSEEPALAPADPDSEANND